jgi:hypothetical protein
VVVTNSLGRSLGGVSVEVCTTASVTSPVCTAPASIYSDTALSVPIACTGPTTCLTTDSLGQVPSFFVAPGYYCYTVSGSYITDTSCKLIVIYAAAAGNAALTGSNNIFTANNTFGGTSTVFSGTAVTFPPATWTIANPFVATYALGTAPVGGSHYLPEDFETTWSGNASANSDAITWHFGNTVSGANNLNFSAAGRFNNTFTGSGTVTDRFIGGLSEATHNGTGTIANMYGHQVRLGILNTGGMTPVSGIMANYEVSPPIMTGAGTAPDFFGFYLSDPGVASTNTLHVTNDLLGFICPEITTPGTTPVITACYYSGITSGTNK